MSVMIKRHHRLFTCVAALLGVAALAFLLGVANGRGGATASGPQYTPAGSKSSSDLIRDAELVGPAEGWALTSDDLVWTTDSGASWTPIRPAGLSAGAIRNVFFTDSLHGWIAAREGPAEVNPSLDIYATSDGGKSWSRSEISDKSQITIGGVQLFFRGDLGWALVGEEIAGGSNATAHLYVTRDGGASWAPLARPPVNGELEFVSATEGWLEGGVGSQSLWRSTDSGQSWSQVAVEAPAAAEGADISYGLPRFSPGGSGLLPVTFTRPSGHTEVAVYETAAAGAAWKLGSLNVLEGSIGIGADSSDATFLGPETVAIQDPGAKGLTLVASRNGRGSGSSQPPSGEVGARGLPGYAPLSFVDREHGVAVVNEETCVEKANCSLDNRLLFSADAGRSWHPSPSRP